MNSYQTELYNNLEALVASGDTFYKQEFSLDAHFYKIYNYRMASYTDFLLPSALEARGCMFELNSNGEPARLASLCIPKFFNLNENPSTMNLDYSNIIEMQEKRDGSLISTYFHKGKVHLKSKGSLFSEQAFDATNWLHLPENKQFLDEVYLALSTQLTINFEWTSEKNRIVIGYENPELTVLNMRDMLNGQYVDPFDCTWTVEIQKRFVKTIKVDDPTTFIQSISEMTGVEGYVARFKDEFRCKIKGAWYVALHHTKDSINSDRRLYETVLSEGSDDLRTLFPDDKLILARIEKMEEFVSKLYNSLVASVEKFYETNKDLIKKDYAILGQKELDKHAFRMAIEKYIRRPVDYKAYLRDHWKDFGLKDEFVEQQEGSV